MTHYANNGAPSLGDRLLGAVTRNPEGLLLLAAGCALLMRTTSRTARADEDRRRWNASMGSETRPSERPGDHRSAIRETVAKAGKNAGEYISDVAEKVGSTAESYASAASDYTDDAIRAVSERSREFAHQAQSSLESTTEYVLERQPLAVAIIGLATGAAAAAAFRPTEMEQRALGPAGERLREAAGEVTERLKEAGTKAGERLMDVAEERGLTREGLKEAARDVGQTFSTAMASGEHQTHGANEDTETSQGRMGRAREAKAGSSRQAADSPKSNR